MKPFVPIATLVLCGLLVACTKGEDIQVTSFEGVVQLGQRDVSFSDVQVEIYGMSTNTRCFLFCDGITKYNKVFPVEPDGSFTLPVTTEDVDYFRLGVRIGGERVLSDCIPRSGCSGLKPGAEHVNLILAPVEE